VAQLLLQASAMTRKHTSDTSSGTPFTDDEVKWFENSERCTSGLSLSYYASHQT